MNSTTATAIRIKPLTTKAMQQFRCRLVEQELVRCGDKADLESIMRATPDTIIFAALRIALAPTAPSPLLLAHVKKVVESTEHAKPVENEFTPTV